ncbi:MAG TPA: isocitrate/isopropylmalate family dehydrogenase [Methanoregulaceae archaeon]|nr:isocitrate/isopropylmalate family dehydrogenase [Methanoregulaceae archaeon]
MTRIAVVEGDGIGKEVIPVAARALSVLRPDWEQVRLELGFERWRRTGTALDDRDLELLRSVDAVLFGAVQSAPNGEYPSVVLALRRALGLFANIRPIRGGGADLVVVRENSEGLYAGRERVEADRACTERVITRIGTERIARTACRLAAGRRHLTIGHKANVLAADRFFLEIARGVAAGEGVAVDDAFIDALCLDVLRRPERYDVILVENMFGDILSDVAAFHVGGLGLLPSANLGDRYALFEPVHGSAPDIAGRGIANPTAALLSAAMLLEHLGDPRAAHLLRSSVETVLFRGERTPDLGGTATTREFGDAVLVSLQKKV